MKEMNDHRKYCAISKNGAYVVCLIGPCGDFHPIGDCRKFETFEEANQVAFDMSFGDYGQYPGEHINMR
jgi:hypothetical protein